MFKNALLFAAFGLFGGQAVHAQFVIPAPVVVPNSTVEQPPTVTGPIKPTGGVYDPDRTGTQLTPDGSLTSGNMRRAGAPAFQDPERGPSPAARQGDIGQQSFTWSSPGLAAGAAVADADTVTPTATPATAIPQPAAPATPLRAPVNQQMDTELPATTTAQGTTTGRNGSTSRYTPTASYETDEAVDESSMTNGRNGRSVERETRVRYERTLEK